MIKLGEIGGKNRKKIIRFCALGLTIIFLSGGVVFGSQKITSAKPGDLLFSVKAYTERSRTPTEQGEIIEYSFKLLDDRLSSFNELLASEQCVQMVLAEEELVKALENVFALIKAGNSFSYYTKLHDLTVNLSAPASSTCTFTTSLKGLPILLTYLELRNDQAVQLDQELKQAKLDYDVIVKTVQASAFSDQATLDAITSAVIEAEENTMNFRRNDDDRLLFDLMQTNKYLYTYINDQLGVGNSAVTQQELAELVCRISDAERCTHQKFEEDWNSINSLSDIVRKVDLGNEVLEEYLALL